MKFENGEYIIYQLITGKEIWRGLDLKNLREANLREADLWEADLRGANLRGAYLHGANLGGAELDYYCPPMLLLAYWGDVSDALCLDLMRYDAANHPNPVTFLTWANGGPCPYNNVNVTRSANFTEKKKLIKDDFLSLPVKSAYELAERLIAEKTKRQE